jgi:hypothetical protein
MQPRPVLFLLPLMFCACEGPAPRLAGSGMEMFTPTAIRLHPLTRIAPAATQPATQPAAQNILEVRFEFTDQFSDPTKGAGTITLQLFDQPGVVHKGPRIDSWTLPLTTPEQHRDHWDRTTRTYLFRLPLAKPLPPGREHLLLTAAMMLPNSQVLVDELQLPLK